MAELLKDGCQDFLGGQDASKLPDKVPDNAYHAGVNVSTKNGCVSPRWGFRLRHLNFPRSGIYDFNGNWRTYKDIFENGKFQALIPYTEGSKPYCYIIVSGIIFLVDLTIYSVSIVPISTGGYLNPRIPRINWTPAGAYTVIFDYPNYPVLISGNAARRADPFSMEVPVSRLGTFNQNRLYVANLLNEFTGGDPIGSLAVGVEAPITFQEVLLPASAYYGQIFQMTTADNNAPITAMGFLQVSDTSTGIGPLLVSTSKAIYSYGTDKARSDWEGGQFGSVLLYNAGIAGPRAMVNANSDMYFIAGDGYVRTISMSRNEQQRWSRVPLSREVENWMTFNDPTLKQYAFCGYFKNKVFFSCNPYRVSATDFFTRKLIADYAHGGLVVLELDNVTSFGETSKPTWAGLWTGVRPMDMINVDERCFIMSKDSSVINHLWELDPTITHDVDGCATRYVRSRLYTKEYVFGDGFKNKSIHSLDYQVQNIAGDFSLDTQYKPAHGHAFKPWRTWKHSAPWRSCDMPGNGFWNGFSWQSVRDVTLGTPEGEGTECDPVTGELYHMFKALQLKLTIQGIYWEITGYRLKALDKAQSQQEAQVCDEYAPVEVPKECSDDWFIGSFDLCLQKMT